MITTDALLASKCNYGTQYTGEDVLHLLLLAPTRSPAPHACRLPAWKRLARRPTATPQALPLLPSGRGGGRRHLRSGSGADDSGAVAGQLFRNMFWCLRVRRTVACFGHFSKVVGERAVRRQINVSDPLDCYSAFCDPASS